LRNSAELHDVHVFHDDAAESWSMRPIAMDHLISVRVIFTILALRDLKKPTACRGMNGTINITHNYEVKSSLVRSIPWHAQPVAGSVRSPAYDLWCNISFAHVRRRSRGCCCTTSAIPPCKRRRRSHRRHEAPVESVAYLFLDRRNDKVSDARMAMHQIAHLQPVGHQHLFPMYVARALISSSETCPWFSRADRRDILAFCQ